MSEGKSNVRSKDSERQNGKQLGDNIYVLIMLDYVVIIML